MTVSEWRRHLKKHHICRECGQTDAYTLGGRTCCYDCAEKQRKAKALARKDPLKHEKMLQSKREQIARYKAENRCVRCGKQLTNGKRMCGICYASQRAASRRSKGCTPRMEGVCWQCNKEPCMDGKKLCRACYDAKVKVALANLEKTRGADHPWRKNPLNLKRE